MGFRPGNVLIDHWLRHLDRNRRDLFLPGILGIGAPADEQNYKKQSSSHIAVPFGTHCMIDLAQLIFKSPV